MKNLRTNNCTINTLHETMNLVVPPGFEPGSWHPECHMMDHYTKGLATRRDGLRISTEPQTNRLHLAEFKRGRTDSNQPALARLVVIHSH